MCCCASLQLVLVCIVCCVFTYIVCFVLIVCCVILCASLQLVFLRPACLQPCDEFYIFYVLCTGCVLCYIVCLPATCALETSLLVCACACCLACCISCTTQPALDRAFCSVSLISSSFYNFISFFSYDYLS